MRLNDDDPAELHLVFAFAMNVGGLMLAGGAAASEIVRTVLQITRKAGLADVSADVTYVELRLSHQPDGSIPYTRIETIRGRTFDYGKLGKTYALVERFYSGEITLTEAAAEVQHIQTSRGPYPWWLTRFATGVAGASAAVIFGAGWQAAIAAFLANLGLDYLLGLFGRREWPTFYMQAAAGVLAVVAALLVHLVSPTADSSRVVVSVIIVMLAGMTSTGAVQDALTGWYVTAIGRLFEALMNTVGLIVGIKLGLLVANRAGLELSVTTNVSLAGVPLPVMLVGAGVVAVSFSVVTQNPPRVLLPTAALSAAAYAAFAGANAIHLGTVWSSAAAAFLAGLVGVFFAQWLKVPAAASATCAILALLPGLTLYRALSATDGHQLDSLGFAVLAVGIALALAGGVSFGAYAAVALNRRFRVVENRFFSPLFATPATTVESSEAPHAAIRKNPESSD